MPDTVLYDPKNPVHLHEPSSLTAPGGLHCDHCKPDRDNLHKITEFITKRERESENNDKIFHPNFSDYLVNILSFILCFVYKTLFTWHILLHKET